MAEITSPNAFAQAIEQAGGFREATFTVGVGDEVELYWATDLAGNPTTPTDGVYIFHDAAQTTPFARPAIPSAIGSIAFVSDNV